MLLAAILEEFLVGASPAMAVGIVNPVDEAWVAPGGCVAVAVVNRAVSGKRGSFGHRLELAARRKDEKKQQGCDEV